MSDIIHQIFNKKIIIDNNIITLDVHKSKTTKNNQKQTKNVFSEKWDKVKKYKNINKFYKGQLDWFLDLYGFSTEKKLKEFLSGKNIIVDTGCGLGYKASWFAKLAPNSIVIGIDISDSIYVAA